MGRTSWLRGRRRCTAALLVVAVCSHVLSVAWSELDTNLAATSAADAGSATSTTSTDSALATSTTVTSTSTTTGLTTSTTPLVSATATTTTPLTTLATSANNPLTVATTSSAAEATEKLQMTNITTSAAKGFQLPEYYHTFDKVKLYFQDLEKNFPEKVKYKEATETLSNLALPTVTITDFTTGEVNKTRIMIVFGEHSNELFTTELSFWLSEVLVKSNSSLYHWPSAEQSLAESHARGMGKGGGYKEWGAALLKTTMFQLIPALNVAGHKQAESGDTCLTMTPEGIDLALNWPMQELAAHNTTHGGEHPLSEPPTRILDRMVISWQPDAFINVRSGIVPNAGVFIPSTAVQSKPETQGPSSQAQNDTQAWGSPELVSAVGVHCACKPAPAPANMSQAVDHIERKVPKVPTILALNLYGKSPTALKDINSSTAKEWTCFSTFNPESQELYRVLIAKWVNVIMSSAEHLALAAHRVERPNVTTQPRIAIGGATITVQETGGTAEAIVDATDAKDPKKVNADEEAVTTIAAKTKEESARLRGQTQDKKLVDEELRFMESLDTLENQIKGHSARDPELSKELIELQTALVGLAATGGEHEGVGSSAAGNGGEASDAEVEVPDATAWSQNASKQIESLRAKVIQYELESQPQGELLKLLTELQTHAGDLSSGAISRVAAQMLLRLQKQRKELADAADRQKRKMEQDEAQKVLNEKPIPGTLVKEPLKPKELQSEQLQPKVVEQVTVIPGAREEILKGLAAKNAGTWDLDPQASTSVTALFSYVAVLCLVLVVSLAVLMYCRCAGIHRSHSNMEKKHSETDLESTMSGPRGSLNVRVKSGDIAISPTGGKSPHARRPANNLLADSDIQVPLHTANSTLTLGLAGHGTHVAHRHAGHNSPGPAQHM